MDPSREKPIHKDEQPTPESLANLGILVRDFAFENTGLPPVRIIFRHPRQIQPGVNRVQRQSTETAEDGAFSQPSQESSQPLERTVTEPVLLPSRPIREQGFLNLDDLDEPLTASQAPAAHPESQNSNGIRTPLVTPDGSLQWEHPKNDVPVPPLNLALNETVPDIPSLSCNRTLSQQTFTFTKQATPVNLSRQSTLSTLSSPLSSASPSPIPTKLKNISPSKKLRRQPSHLVKPNDASNNTTPEKLARRYNLRKRPTKGIDTNNGSKRMKFAHAEPVARPSLSAQSIQLRNTSNSGEGSRTSRSRPIKCTKKKL